MPLQRGVNPDKASVGYLSALQGFTIEAITHGIRRFLRGECEGVNPKFCPHPPELADIIRKTVHSKPERKRYFMYRKPRSALLERGVTKEYAFRLIDNGVHPRGSIWCPGSVDDRPDIGDLFGPDPEWKPAVPTNETPDSTPYQPDDPIARIRMGFKMSVLSAGIALGKVDDVARANVEGIDSLMALAQQWGVAIPEELFNRRAA